MFNPFSEEERLQTMLACCYAAVQQGGFQHLALRDIIDPPHEWFDAMLARQIAIHILATRFGVPKRRIVMMQARIVVLDSQHILMVRTVDAQVPVSQTSARFASTAAIHVDYQNPATVPFQNAPFVHQPFGAPVPRVQKRIT
ncbi:hypothetical protein GRI33_06980 [Brucella sp. BO3]|uniref:hypothetical protein n=1 Tax=Brucella sp. BO3 TaxID=2691913 RepID=UPI0015F65903|nr:hypothetical protein [Brucella sp. BO3]QMV26684.1 hypothetical protein GRI33_06980 [Brucella sp. BO3]